MATAPPPIGAISSHCPTTRGFVAVRVSAWECARPRARSGWVCARVCEAACRRRGCPGLPHQPVEPSPGGKSLQPSGGPPALWPGQCAPGSVRGTRRWPPVGYLGRVGGARGLAWGALQVPRCGIPEDLDGPSVPAPRAQLPAP